ncbi:hypothetical protein J8TS2_28040 [Lederbergia ruris]|uniref:Uncharacterized protein n=1 Tax=Lederbergia ruris TaxID=217495 RepID=A0ABQ4KKK3_9BACI|nr:hypothetical protein [Lederbergia ruris]GIN58485.1 hypothetical protein J8TS2_28040 [Lederbergia ruris]
MRKKIYECYSYNLMRFLMENGQVPFSVSIHKRSRKTMWTFEMNPKLSRLLNVWTNKENIIDKASI